MQKVNLYEPIVHEGHNVPPLTLRVGVQTNSGFVEGGTPQAYLKSETYVLLSALPQELQQRVIVAVQSLISGM